MLRHTVELDDDEDPIEDARPDWRTRLRRRMLRRPKDAVAVVVAVAGAGSIAVNALFMQTGPHPAPLFSLRSIVTGTSTTGSVGELPRPRPAVAETTAIAPATQAATQAPRSRNDLVADIQRGLAKRGRYDGAVDGIYGPKTDAAVRDFAQTAHLKVDAEPTEALLRDITHSAINEIKPSPVAAMSHSRRDPIGDLIGPSPRILAVQRALADFGYGQIKPTGVLGPDTMAAIEKFERSRQMPVTGQISDRLTRELTAVTGRPLE